MRGFRSPKRHTGAAVLGYHNVCLDRSGSPTADASLAVTAKQLRRHIWLLRKLGFTIVPLGEIVAELGHQNRVDGMAALTFDDSLVGVHDVALPILAELDAPATIFATTSEFGVEPAWWAGAERSMTLEELTAVVSNGHTVGSHTASHRSLVELSDPDLASELRDSKQFLEHLVGTSVDLLAYPSGHHDPRVRQAAQDAGYIAAFTFLNGRVLSSDDIHRLPRLNMGAHSTVARFAYHLIRGPGTWPDHQLNAVGAD